MKTKPKKRGKCSWKGCFNVKKLVKSKGYYCEYKHCSSHATNKSIRCYISKVYQRMNFRVRGSNSPRDRKYYFGKPILPKEAFVNWAENHPTFLSLYKQWFSSNFDRRLTPTVNRMDSSKGYTLDNMEWMTLSANCSLAGSVKKMNNRKVIYDILGVKNG